VKVVILAGGLGTRLVEETRIRPKPMVEIGGMPILWHIMKIYAHHGFREFVVALGYKGDVIKRYFLDYTRVNSNLTVDLGSGNVKLQHKKAEDWTLHLWDTGPQTQTGGRVRRLRDLLQDDTFMMTYGDGVSDVNVKRLLEFHRKSGKLVTLTAVRPPARYGSLRFKGDEVAGFSEKNPADEAMVNGGFFVIEPATLDRIGGDADTWEAHVLEKLAADRQLAAYKHTGFWQSVDTLRDVNHLNALWDSGQAPWKVWSA
jgi:glucose-1-phosphate cytidylyltransferase